MSTPEQCKASRIPAAYVKKAAEALYHAFVKEDRYGPIDKLGLAASPDSLLVALFEIERGVRGVRELTSKDEFRDALTRLEEIVDAIISDLRNPECVEKARSLANMLAVRALAFRR